MTNEQATGDSADVGDDVDGGDDRGGRGGENAGRGERGAGVGLRRRTVWLVTGLVVAGLLVAGVVVATRDGDPGPGGGPDVSTDADAASSSGVRIVLAAPPAANEARLDDAAGVIRDRAEALGADDVEVTRDGDRLVVTVPDDDRSDRLTELLGQEGELRFRPVLSSMPARGANDPPVPVLELTPPEGDAGDASVTLADEDGEIVFQLGPALATGGVIESAEAERGSVAFEHTGEATLMWQVNLTMRAGADGIDRFNTAAATCNPPGERCPTGQLAIVVDSVVQSAPTIQQPSFERDQIVITGSFTEREAEDLALVLASGRLPVPLDTESVTPIGGGVSPPTSG